LGLPIKPHNDSVFYFVWPYLLPGPSTQGERRGGNANDSSSCIAKEMYFPVVAQRNTARVRPGTDLRGSAL